MNETEKQAAKDEAIRAVVFYGTELAVMAVMLWAVRNKPWIEHQWWRWQHRHDRVREDEDQAVTDLRRQISEFEHDQER